MQPFLYIMVLVTMLMGSLSEVIEYKGPETEAAILEDPHIHIVKVSSKLCGSCKEFAPTWDKFTEMYAKSYKFVTVNVDTPEGMEYAKKIGATDVGIPAVLMYKSTTDTKPELLFGGKPVSIRKLSLDVHDALGKSHLPSEERVLKLPPSATESEL